MGSHGAWPPRAAKISFCLSFSSSSGWDVSGILGPLLPRAAVNGNAGVLGTHKSLSGIHNLIKTSRQECFNTHGEVLERRPGSRQSSKNNKALAIKGVLRLRKTGMNSRPSRARVWEAL